MIDQLLKATREENWSQASALLYKHWSNNCPSAYNVLLENPWEFVVDDKKILNELIYPLAAMFCCEDFSKDCEEKDVSLNRLNKLTGIDSSIRRQGRICGRVFKNGEANYTCKECATDNTCVLCHECFVNSNHATHKYKMHTSLGYGYCDCGDQEAWSQDFACRLHIAEEENNSMIKSNEPELSRELEARVYNLSLIAMKFAVTLLCLKQTDVTPVFIEQYVCKDENYQTVLFNDETHTYDAVIRALELAVHCTTNQAMRLATIVDREGRSIVKTGGYEICNSVKTSIERRTQKETNRRTQKTGPLEVKVFKSSLVSYQTFAVRLLTWLSSKVQEFVPLSKIIGDVVLYACSHNQCGFWKSNEKNLIVESNSMDLTCDHRSNCLKLMLEDRKLWKAARASFHQMLMSTVLMNFKQKQEFGKLFVNNYKTIFNDFIDDDHEHSISITSMSVQVFTVHTVARYLIIETNVLSTILSCFKVFCQKYIKSSSYNDSLFQLDFSNDSHPAVLKRAMHMFSDITYLLCIIPKPEEWSDNLRNNFLSGCNDFLQFLRDVEGMDEVKRQSIEHQLMESEWETAFNIFINVQESISLFLSWARSDKIVHMKLFKKCLLEICQKINYMKEFNEPRTIIKVNSISAHCISFEVSKCPISIHHPLWRFIAGLFTSSPEILENYYSNEHVNYDNTSIHEKMQKLSSELNNDLEPGEKFDICGFRSILMEIPLRVIVLQAQSYAQMWRRNGFSLINQVHNYSSHLCRTEMNDRDILLLQAIAALVNPDKFLIRVLHRFELNRWAEIGFENLSNPVSNNDATSSNPEELSKIYVLLAEEMFHLLIIILGERYLPGVGEVTEMQALEREIIHFLCTGPKPFSQIERIVPNDPIMQRLSLYDAVNNVSEFKKPSPASSGVFYLREKFLQEYNQFFYHYSKPLISQADQFQKKERSKKSRELIACPPPMPPKFMSFFKPILRLMETATFSRLLRIVFERVIKRSRFVSEGLFHRALFLIGMALNEQKRAIESQENFNFWEKAKEEHVFAFLSKLENRPEIEAQADLLWWVMQKIIEISKLLSNKSTDCINSMSDTTISFQEKNAERANKAARKRQLAMERMKKLQKQFQKQNKILDSETDGGQNKTGNLNTDKENKVMDNDYDDDCEFGIVSPSSGFPVCCGIDKTKLTSICERKITCILCQESEILSYKNKPIVCAGYIQSSRLFSINKPLREDKFQLYAPVDLNLNVNVSTCSHTMHYGCYNSFMNTILGRDRQRVRQQAFPRMTNAEVGEYLCPLCKRLSNCALPLLPVISTIPDLIGFSKLDDLNTNNFEEWLSKLRFNILNPTNETLKEKGNSHGRKRSYSECTLMDYNKIDSKINNRNSKIVSTSSAGLNVFAADLTEPNLLSNNGLFSTFFSNPDSHTFHEQNNEDPLISVDSLNLTRDDESSSMSGATIYLNRIMKWVFGEKKGTTNCKKCFIETNVPKSFVNWEIVENFMQCLLKKSNILQEVDLHLFMRLVEFVEVLKACVFLLRSVSSILEIEEKPLFGALNTRHRDCITAMVRLAIVAQLNCQPTGICAFIIRYLFILLTPINRTNSKNLNSESINTPKCFQNIMKEDFVNILNMDMVTLAIQLITCIGWLSINSTNAVLNKNNKFKSFSQYYVADGSKEELNIIRLTLLGHLFQIFANFNASDEKELTEAEEKLLNKKLDGPLDEKLENRIKWLYSTFFKNNLNCINVNKLYKKLCDATVSFLRPTAIFYHTLTLVPPPEVLKDPSLNEFSPLCRYMGLPPHLKDLLSGAEVTTLFELWSQYLEQKNPFNFVDLPLKIKLLIDLPKSYSELMNKAANFRCPSLQVDDIISAVPTLCLNCGVMMCSQSYCCQKTLNNTTVGACTYHMKSCGKSSGIFLRIRDCQIFLLTTRDGIVGGCYKAAPYVDEFGETDQGFRRGNPMQLSPEHYFKFQRIWIHQDIAEEVQNQYEIYHRNIAFEWQHF